MNRISDAIDELLDRPKWSAKEQRFYEMLVSKVHKYRRQGRPKPRGSASPPPPSLPPPSSPSSDINDIMQNIKDQQWYKASHNQGTIANLVSQLKIVNCSYSPEPYIYNLELGIGQCALLMSCKARGTLFDFSFYYQHGSVTAYIARSGADTDLAALPDYQALIRIFPTLTRYEIVCLSIEILLYYDVDHIMSTLPIGQRYPISLASLLNCVQEQIGSKMKYR